MFLQDLSSPPICGRICDLVGHTQFLHPAKKNEKYSDVKAWLVKDRGKGGLGYAVARNYFKIHPVNISSCYHARTTMLQFKIGLHTLNAPIRFPWLTKFLPVKTWKHYHIIIDY